MNRIQLRIAVGGNLVVEGVDEAVAVLHARDLDELVRASTAVAKRVYSVESEQELRKLGCKVHASTWVVAGREVTKHLCLSAPRDAQRVWRMLDQVALEAAFEEPDFAVTRGAVVRGVCATAPEPLEAGARAMKALFVGASPRSETLRPFDLDRSLAPLKDASERLVLGFSYREVRGPDTLEKLRATLLADPVWDIVHIVAHGRRGQRDVVCLESSSGSEHWLPYEDLACELQKLDGVRLFTLEVCESSPLALQLALAFPGARAVGLRNEMVQEEARRMFAEMWKALLFAPTGGRAEVERAFHEATRKLKTDRVRGWFVPVLYGPWDAKPLADLRSELDLRRVVELVAAAQLGEALERASGLARSPFPRVAQKARALEGEIHRLRCFHQNFDELERELETTAGEPATADWRGLHRKWSQRYFALPAMAGARMTDISMEPISLQFFPRILHALDAQRASVVQGIECLARYREGQTGALLEGCRELARVGGERPSDPLKRASSLVFEAELGEIVRRASPPAPSGARSARPPNTTLEQALRVLTEATEMLRSAAPQLLTPSSRARLEKELNAARHDLAEVANQLFSPPRPDEALLAPGGRFDLWRWRLAMAESPCVVPPRALMEVLPDVAARLARLPRHPVLDWQSAHPGSLTLLVNEEASVRFTAAVDEPLNPYFVLRSFGVHLDAPFDFLKRLSFDVEALDASERSSQMRHALRDLLDVGRRLEIDVGLAGCVDMAECTARLDALAAAALRGEPVPERLFAGLANIDRAVLLAAAGRTAEATQTAWTVALADSPPGFGVLRTAFLIVVHHASRAQQDREAYLDAVRRAIALHGLLEAQPREMDRWVRGRLAVYSGFVPHSDVSDHRTACMKALAALVLDSIDRAERAGAVDAPLARRLRRELRAEADGARESFQWLQKKRMTGGYHALRLSGRLPAVGEALAGSLQALRRRNRQELIGLASATGLTVDLFHRRVFLFSELRIAMSDAGEEALTRLEPWLPRAEPVAGVEQPASREPPNPEFGELFPMHARLSAEDAWTSLRVHAAMAAVESLLELARRELAKPRPAPQILREVLGQAAELNRHVARLKYAPGGEPPDLLRQVPALVIGWTMTAGGHLQGSDDPPGGTLDAKDRKEALEHACMVADALLEYAPGHEPAVRAVATLHQNVGAVMAIRFKDTRAAMEHLGAAHQADPANPYVVVNLARTAKIRAGELRAERKLALAESVLHEALSVVIDFKYSHPDARGPDGEAFDDLVAELAASLKDPGEPDPTPPPFPILFNARRKS